MDVRRARTGRASARPRSGELRKHRRAGHRAEWGFATLALNASYRIGKRALLSAGIDNVFDRTYAEHISRAAAAVAGYDAPTTRVNEPGRFVWAKLSMSFD